MVINGEEYTFVKELTVSKQIVVRDSNRRKHRFYFWEVDDYTPEPIKYKPLKRTRIKPINADRKKKAFKRNFHSKERVEYVQALGCIICDKTPCVNAHVKSRGSGKGTYKTIVPMCDHHHKELDEVLGFKKFQKKYNVDLLLLAEVVEYDYQNYLNQNKD